MVGGHGLPDHPGVTAAACRWAPGSGGIMDRRLDPPLLLANLRALVSGCGRPPFIQAKPATSSLRNAPRAGRWQTSELHV